MTDNINRPQVSVVIVTYNQKGYIRDALEGAINQKTDFRYEIIVKDDASTDGTREIVEEYAAGYPDLIVPILEEENQYQKPLAGDAAKHILEKVRGRYVACCDGDDYFCDEDKLQLQFDVMEAHPECSMCVSETRLIKEDGSEVIKTLPNRENFSQWGGLKEGVVPREVVADLIINKKISYPFSTVTYFVRYEPYRLSKSYRVEMHGDAKTNYCAMAYGDYYFIDRVLGVRRQNALGSFSREGSHQPKCEDDVTLARSRVDFWGEIYHAAGGDYPESQWSRTALRNLIWLYIRGDIAYNDLLKRCGYMGLELGDILDRQPDKIRRRFNMRRRFPFLLNMYYSIKK